MGKIIGWLLGWIVRIPPRDFEKTLEATLRVLSDRPIKPVDALLLFGRAKGDDSSELFDFVATFIYEGKAKNVLLNGSRGEKQGSKIPGESWDGGEIFWERLEERHVNIECKHLSKPAFNTSEEAKVFLEYAITQKWRSVVLVAWPHQILRCLGHMVNAMKERRFYLDVYCACPSGCDWHKDVAGSQGMNMMERRLHINLEYSRIHQYVGKGIATVDEILLYLDHRDKIPA